MEMPDIVETGLDFDSLSQRNTTDMIVIHHTGDTDMDVSAATIHGRHKAQDWAGIGYHFVIRKDGTIERGRPEWAIGSHAYGENSHTIGIHVCGGFVGGIRPTTAQVEKVSMLVAALCDKYGIPCDRQHVVGHCDLMSTGCPGANLYALLEDGTLIGKANWYLNGGEESSENQTINQTIIERYQTIDDVPEWGKEAVKNSIRRGILKGTGDGLDIDAKDLRYIVWLDRGLTWLNSMV